MMTSLLGSSFFMFIFKELMRIVITVATTKKSKLLKFREKVYYEKLSDLNKKMEEKKMSC